MARSDVTIGGLFFETSELGGVPEALGGWDRISHFSQRTREMGHPLLVWGAYEYRGPSLGGLRLVRRPPLPQDDKSRTCRLLLILFAGETRDLDRSAELSQLPGCRNS